MESEDDDKFKKKSASVLPPVYHGALVLAGVTSVSFAEMGGGPVAAGRGVSAGGAEGTGRRACYHI